MPSCRASGFSGARSTTATRLDADSTSSLAKPHAPSENMIFIGYLSQKYNSKANYLTNICKFEIPILLQKKFLKTNIFFRIFATKIFAKDICDIMSSWLHPSVDLARRSLISWALRGRDPLLSESIYTIEITNIYVSHNIYNRYITHIYYI